MQTKRYTLPSGEPSLPVIILRLALIGAAIIFLASLIIAGLEKMKPPVPPAENTVTNSIGSKFVTAIRILLP